jgi:hypothetical protein
MTPAAPPVHNSPPTPFVRLLAPLLLCLTSSCSDRDADAPAHPSTMTKSPAQDNRLCRIIGVAWWSNGAPVHNFEEMLLHRDGTYVWHFTNAQPEDVLEFVATGRVSQAIFNSLSNSLYETQWSNDWSRSDGLPTFTNNVFDYKRGKPTGVIQFRHELYEDWAARQRSQSNALPSGASRPTVP